MCAFRRIRDLWWRLVRSRRIYLFFVLNALSAFIIEQFSDYATVLTRMLNAVQFILLCISNIHLPFMAFRFVSQCIREPQVHLAIFTMHVSSPTNEARLLSPLVYLDFLISIDIWAGSTLSRTWSISMWSCSSAPAFGRRKKLYSAISLPGTTPSSSSWLLRVHGFRRYTTWYASRVPTHPLADLNVFVSYPFWRRWSWRIRRYCCSCRRILRRPGLALPRRLLPLDPCKATDRSTDTTSAGWESERWLQPHLQPKAFSLIPIFNLQRNWSL